MQTRSKAKQRKPSRLARQLFTLGGLLLVLVVTLIIAFQLSPWPAVLLMRHVTGNSDLQHPSLDEQVPPGVESIRDLAYRPGDPDAVLDVYYPTAAAEGRALPVIVWVHGGGWVLGSKESVAAYSQVLASHGYTVVALGYSLAPEKYYPVPVLQVNDALTFLQGNAIHLHIDPSFFILAGNSAGAQIAAQVAAITTNPGYAEEMNITPALRPEQLRGTILANGAYDTALPDYNSRAGRLLRPILWAYSGEKDFQSSEAFRTASVVNYVTVDFPPSFITVGNGDPLESHSRELAAKLQALGVRTEALFYPPDHQPSLPHGYLLNFVTPDGKQALARLLGFLDSLLP